MAYLIGNCNCIGCLGYTELKLKWCTLLLDDEITEFLSLTDWKKRKNK